MIYCQSQTLILESLDSLVIWDARKRSIKSFKVHEKAVDSVCSTALWAVWHCNDCCRTVAELHGLQYWSNCCNRNVNSEMFIRSCCTTHWSNTLQFTAKSLSNLNEFFRIFISFYTLQSFKPWQFTIIYNAMLGGTALIKLRDMFYWPDMMCFAWHKWLILFRHIYPLKIEGWSLSHYFCWPYKASSW